MAKTRVRRDNKLLTTGQIARYTGLSQQMIIRLIDQGHLEGTRIPFSRHRRVRAEFAEAFARANGLPWERNGEASRGD